MKSTTTREPMRADNSGAAGDWAICCSGGGIRSAAYCLGALQSLDQEELVKEARWILGVSGGSYIAASRALVARGLPAETQRAYAPGTPEERNLRYDTRYLAPNVPTILVGALSLLLGAVGTFVIALAPLYAVAHAWGWLLRWRGALVPSGHTMTAAVTGPAWWLPSVTAAGIVLVLFGYWWWTLAPNTRHFGGALAALKPDDRDRGDDRAWLVSWAARLTAALALAMLAVPPLISWLTSSTGSVGSIAHFLGFGAKPSWSLSGLAGLIAAVAAVARYCQAGIAKWTASTSAARGSSAAAGLPGPLGQLTGKMRQQLLPWLGSTAVVLVGAVLALLWVSDGARAGYSPGQLLPVGVALAVALAARLVVDVNRLSMHDFYRWRLANAFAVTREAAEERNPRQARALFAKAAATRLSDLREKRRAADEPGLVICGTANINAEREVPPGQDGFCVAFDPEHVTLRREKGLPEPQHAQARTSDYEALVGKRRTTLFDVSAVSGAAVSPLMGAATRHAYRILLTAANICLGVWLPHPSLVRDARGQLDHPDEDTVSSRWERHPLLLLGWYLMPHPLWARNPDKNARREARLWAHVLKRRLDGRPSGALWYRVMQPTLGLKWAEAAGRLSYRATWMYVTDGGHYDNLGLVEALRRGASNIVILDASGDKADTWFTLGGAIALARTDAGVEIDLDPTTMARSGHALAPGQVVRPWAHGRFRRSQPVAGLPGEGDIWVCKLGWWTGAPWDVLAYARQHPTYPCDSTLEQLYDAAEFEAYHQLGAAAVLDAAKKCQPALTPPPAPKIPAMAPAGPPASLLRRPRSPARRQALATEGRKTHEPGGRRLTVPGVDVVAESRDTK
jgi:Patatin-like phospholipase